MMDESTSRDTVQELIQLQINILTSYTQLMDSKEWGDAKKALNEAIKKVVDAVGPVLTVQHLAAQKTVDVHRTAVDQAVALLKKLLEKEKQRAALHDRIRERTEGGAPRS